MRSLVPVTKINIDIYRKISEDLINGRDPNLSVRKREHKQYAYFKSDYTTLDNNMRPLVIDALGINENIAVYGCCEGHEKNSAYIILMAPDEYKYLLWELAESISVWPAYKATIIQVVAVVRDTVMGPCIDLDSTHTGLRLSCLKRTEHKKFLRALQIAFMTCRIKHTSDNFARENSELINYLKQQSVRDERDRSLQDMEINQHRAMNKGKRVPASALEIEFERIKRLKASLYKGDPNDL